MARFVLIDKKNQVCGDTAVFAAHSDEWARVSALDKNDIAGLAKVAARLLDESRGATRHDYDFTSFAMNGDPGFFVFDCEVDRAPPPLVPDGADPEATAAVMSACFYVGYLRRH